MNIAIIFVKNKKEVKLSETLILGKKLIEYTINELKKLDLDTIFVCGENVDIDSATKRNDIKEIINDLKGDTGRCILTSPFYPLLSKDEYKECLITNEPLCFVSGQDLVNVFCLNNSDLNSFESLNYVPYYLDSDCSLKIESKDDLPIIEDYLRERINMSHLKKGVEIKDIYNTYIGPDVMIDKNTIIYPNVSIEGKCLIGKNNTIKQNSVLENVVMGNDNYIDGATIEDSIIHNKISIGKNSHISENSEIEDEVTIGNNGDLNNVRIKKNTYIAHKVTLENADIGENVNIATGVTTVGKDTRNKYATVIKSNSLIGANSNLLAPLTIGEYAVIAAGSSIDTDVKDGDMAIARIYQTNKKGYGYRYLGKEK